MAYLQTGQQTCHDASGREMRCAGSGQDAAFSAGVPWPQPRFEAGDQLVLDRLTGLVWTRDANPAEFPVTWQEALAFVARMNRDGALGFSDWRLPNRRELRSLMSVDTVGRRCRRGTRSAMSTPAGSGPRPARPSARPTPGMSTWKGRGCFTAARTSRSWSGRCGAWATASFRPRDKPAASTFRGARCPAGGSGQDGETRAGRAWPTPRFAAGGDVMSDRLTGLGWRRCADLTGSPVAWDDALAAVAELAGTDGAGSAALML